ncbi:hypothetical protein Asulf_00555 [Archaeoglobus sulfaticallidus PM70-1]|uniref:Uncharacterized protein n=1 Tax=Archaeoglobus sulfaticallidus PM70-1 TaxID=387631 RepID=N0BJD7_9EURY|nr:hypothetical protein [Archaeoglobus sulfaticallidus]AGK60576.1 hypothetical protein Asulf_00555 [Archaeoglobus sulfaticallidus PM70-1]
MENFIKDLNELVEKISDDLEEEQKSEILRLRDNLVELKERKIVNTAHSVMELIVARHLLDKGYSVDVEYNLNSISCDVYGEKGLGNIIVEIETGFVPPFHALDPQRYLRARISSKIARYSHYCSKFVIGVPQHYLMPVDEIFLLPPRKRKLSELKRVKSLCDIYYSNPPVTINEVKNARLHSIYILDVDNASLTELDPETYYEILRKHRDILIPQ